MPDIVGTFTVTISGDRIGGKSENSAKIQVRRQGTDSIIDPAGNMVHFPHETARDLVGVSLPYLLTLPTDVASGTSTDLGYTITVTTAYGGRVSTDFAAQASGAAVNFADLVPEVVVPLVPDAVTTANFDTMMQAEIDDEGSPFSTSLVTSIGRVAPRTFGVEAATGSDWTRINEQVAAAANGGGGRVTLQPCDHYTVVAPIVLPSKVVLDLNGSTLALANGVNSNVVESEDFATLTGTNAWLVSAGVPAGFGVVNGVISGNKDNNATGHGVAFYGKRFQADNLIIEKCSDSGWYSECANAGGQTTYEDLPETMIRAVWTRENDGIGFHYRGPHDGHIDQLISCVNGLEGIWFEGDGATYNGTADVSRIHTYSNGQRYLTMTRARGAGIRMSGTGSGIRCSQLISESNYGPAIIGAGGNTLVGKMFFYRNFARYDGSTAAATDVHVQLAFQDMHIDDLVCTTDYGGSAIAATAANIQISKMLLRGYGSTGIALDIDANNLRVNQHHIDGFSGVGAHAIRLNATTGRAGTYLRGTVYNCTNGITAGINGGTGNMYLGLDHDIRVSVEGTSAAQTAHNLDTNFTTTTKPVNSTVVIVPRGATTTPKLKMDTI